MEIRTKNMCQNYIAQTTIEIENVFVVKFDANKGKNLARVR
jgi:hypothetical protein